jgi:hypothetical protein
MTDLEALRRLAARVEALERPNREIGMEVLLACGWVRISHGNFMGPLYGWRSPDRTIYFDDDNFDLRKWNPAQYLDVAMSLVPEGWRVAWMGETVIEGNDPWNVRLLEKRFDGRARQSEGDAATPALALCAAALRALAAKEPTP